MVVAVSAWANREGFEHDYEVYHGVVPAERYLENDELPQEGRDLVSFLTATPWDDLTEGLRQASLEVLRSRRTGDQIDHAGGCLIFDSRKHAAPTA